ncbi:MAG: carbohydrate porin [Deltaproteobacteria bacterium]|nr:carbohydrate porin [Deltaproteobacteria bacterium]
MHSSSRTALRAALAGLALTAACFARTAQAADEDTSKPAPAPAPPAEGTAPAEPPAAATPTPAPAKPATPTAAAAAAPPKEEPKEAAPKSNAPPGEEAEGFHFGSYGRVRAATDMRGGGPQYANIVAHGSRLDSEPYAELELRNTQYPEKGMRLRVISTLAFAGDPFHYTGKFETKLAIRNLFVDVRGIGLPGLTLWAGSRMYRGDDIYLLDFWPLDNLNTVGGGAILDATKSTRVQIHVGTNRLIDGSFQYQERQLPSPTGVGSVSAQTLNRPRTIVSGKITQFFPDNQARQGFKVSLHAEGHLLPSGVLESSTTTVRSPTYLPADNGFVIGAQATPYGFGDRDGFAHLFVRYARGIAAYGDLSTPFGLNGERRASGASEFLVAAASNFQVDRFAVLTGAYLRRFNDASSAVYSVNKFWEGILSVRPYVYTSEHTGIAVEGSYQYRNANVLDNWGKHRVPQVARFSLLPFVTPWGWGTFRRPILFALYTATARNESARLMYPTDDPRSTRSVEHYVGIGAEWWFNSSSYP